MSDTNLIERAGGILVIIGGASFAAIALCVLVNGTWPQALKPVQHTFAFLSDWIGEWALAIEIWAFIGPGMLLMWMGSKIRERHEYRALYPKA
jgi:hypothetical protein